MKYRLRVPMGIRAQSPVVPVPVGFDALDSDFDSDLVSDFAAAGFDSPDFESDDFDSDVFDSPDFDSPGFDSPGFDSPDDDSPEPAPVGLPVALPEPEPRKSVTYQPLPFNWKPAAVTIFENVSWPHAGHLVCGGSLNFWRNSSWWPQPEHLYS
jgi:hypothetical protein